MNISLENKKFNIFNTNSFVAIDELIEQNIKVDHIITDPPYNIAKENNFSTMKVGKRVGIDFGEWDHNFAVLSWIPKYCKLIKKNGSIIIFCSYRYISHIIDILESDECNFTVKDIIIWQKSNPMPRNRDRRYVQDMEFAIWAVNKDAKWVFNRPNDKPYLRSLYSTSLVSGKEKTGHPTQKSLKLMEEIIKVHTNENELILDPFMGSGSTGEAALKLNRKFIGIESSEDFFEISKNRLKEYEL